MFNPYFFTIFLYVLLAVIGALDASLVGYEIIPWVNGLRWMRVHLVTLGVMTQFIFAAAPALVALRSNQPRPQFRWDIWATLNVGMMALLYGIPLVNLAVILVGGTLIFIAATLLAVQLYQIRRQDKMVIAGGSASTDIHTGRKFYVAGLGYLLFGIFIGTGLWMGLPGLLRMATPVEVHIHANNWGFMSLVFAGFMVDAYPQFSGRHLAWPRSITPIFWLMVFGALGLTLGPWFESLYFTVPGLLLHLAGTIWLLLNVIKPLLGDRKAWTPGMWHLVSAYFWILAPILTAPFVILSVPGLNGHAVEANAPQALIYGWVLQVGYALLPYFVRRVVQPGQPASLGGNWFSLALVNVGSIFLWLSIFISPAYGILLGTAYALWALSLLPIARELLQTLRQGMDRLEETASA